MAVVEQLRGHLSIVCFVGLAGKFVFLAREYALCTEIMERQMEAAHTGEQVDERVCGFLWLCSHVKSLPDVSVSGNPIHDNSLWIYFGISLDV